MDSLIEIANTKIARIFKKSHILKEKMQFSINWYALKLRGRFYIVKKQKQPPEVFYKKGCSIKISQNSQENTCAKVSYRVMISVNVPTVAYFIYRALQMSIVKHFYLHSIKSEFGNKEKVEFFIIFHDNPYFKKHSNMNEIYQFRANIHLFFYIWNIYKQSTFH